MALPTELTLEPLSRPQETRTDKGKVRRQECSTCGLPYPAHSKLCRICGQYVEHHDDQGVEDCIAGRARMARARFLAGSALDEVDEIVLRLVNGA